MKLTQLLLCASLVGATILPAQGQLLRGKVEDIQGTQRFRLDGTNLELTSTAINLNTLLGQHVEMRVTPATASRLDVLSATPIAKVFDMGNLRLGRSDRWQVSGTPGELAGMFLTATSLTGYTPAGPMGTWLLGSTWLTIATGTIGGQGAFETSFQPPNVPQLVGTVWTAQGVRAPAAGVPYVTNPDSKTLQVN